LLADIGIIGLPNAGKSTLLAAVTAARPKIADYPFTTLIPNLGVAVVNDQDFVLADIPGLIAGAHHGAGLGDRFLRHIERTRLLIHLLDGANENALAALDAIHRELQEFNPALAEKPQLVGVNKMDLPEAQKNFPRIERALKKRGLEVYALAAATGEGVQPLLRRAAARLRELKAAAPEPSKEAAMAVFRPAPDENAFIITQEEITARKGVRQRLFRVRGTRAERLAAMTNWEQEEGVARVHRVLEAMGINEALRAAGIRPGDTVQIGEVELEWSEGMGGFDR
jgi:GTP-binding protein